MNKLKIFNSLLILPIPPIFFFLCFWWSSISMVSEGYVKYFALGGFVLGLLIDIVIYKKYLKKELSKTILVLSYIFYSICTFGFFMGVPAFNILICIPFGIYIYLYKRDILKRFGIFTTIFTFLICISSAYIAITDEYTISGLEGMFGIHLTQTLLYVLISIGGVGLVIINYLFSIYSGRLFEVITKKKG